MSCMPDCDRYRQIQLELAVAQESILMAESRELRALHECRMLRAEVERLRELLSDGREIVAEKLPAYRLWVSDVDAALVGKE